MKNQWVIKPHPVESIINLLMEQVKLPKPLAIILAQRGVHSFDQAKEFFRPQLEQLHDPHQMKDMDRAVQRVLHALEEGEKILVYGDYDVDGTTSVAMMYDFLTSLYPDVDYYIPDRYTEGYGISFQGIDYAVENGYSLIIALDCGIKALDKVDYANARNVDFIICDHHLAGEQIPDAVAVLDPKRKDCQYPFKELTGCGVGFKLIQALAKELRLDKESIFQYLDYLVVSVAADIVPIVGENRIFAHYGLEKLKTNPRPGLASLLGETSLEGLTISNIVFTIAPKINATGRLEHASQSVELLISKDKAQIEKFTLAINDLNTQRKETDGSITQEAIQQIIEDKEEERFTTVVFNPNWHKGVLGIVASRLIETYYRPTLVLTKGNDGEITGSARSVKDFDIYEIIDMCSDLLSKYGGHKFAAGLTMPEENFLPFKEKFEELVKERIRPIQRKPTIEIDTELEFSQITPFFLKVLKQMNPFGPENMNPVFLTKNLIGGDLKLMGKNEEHLRLMLWDERSRISQPAVAFGMGEFKTDFQYGRFDVVYTIEENHWKGNSYVQLNIRDVRFKD